jgi:hypothetical protein
VQDEVMMSRGILCFALGALALSTAAVAQPVEVTTLSAPDFFSNGARDTGLGPDLWTGSSAQTARTVIPMIAAKPLSPAAQALARRVLATGATGPDGAGQDAELAGARINALIAQGAVKDAGVILSRTANLERSPALAKAGAEAALLAGEDQRACQIAEGLATGREEIYWLRLRAYCQLLAGQAGPAQLTFDLAQGLERDAVYGRLMIAKLAGGGDPGAPSARNGLDYALSRSLGLDLASAEPSAAVAAALRPVEPGPPTWTIEGSDPVRTAMAAVAAGDLAGAQTQRGSLTAEGVSANDLALLDALISAASGRPDGPTLDRLIERGTVADAKARGKMQNAAILFAALGGPMTPNARGEFAKFAGAESGKATVAKGLALDLAGAGKVQGETALLALWMSADAGLAGPPVGDRARIIRALKGAGLEDDARAFAVEGLLAQR